MNKTKITNSIKQIARISILAVAVVIAMPIRLGIVILNWVTNGMMYAVNRLLKMLKETKVTTENNKDNDTNRNNHTA